MSEEKFISAILLAAGTASRMGSQKQLVRLGDRTLLGHSLRNLRAARRVSEIVVVLGASAEEIRPLVTNTKVVVNEAYAEGMASSLQAGLKAVDVRANAVFVMLADMPLVKPETLDQLIQAYEAHAPQILIPLYRGFRGNPVLLDQSVFPEIAGLQGDTGCRAIFGDHLENIRKLAVDDPGVLLDADRPQDVETLREVYQSGRFDLPSSETRATEAEAELIVVGRENVASAVVKFARLLGFGVTVVDPLLTFAEMQDATGILRVMDFTQLPKTGARRFCVVASMGRFDEEAIEQAVNAGIGYIALVANKQRSREVLASLGLRGVSSDKLKSVRAKPGLAIGAQGPAEIALSIVAEIVKELRG
jgi:molybdenum cofactor cytidylyltransferase